MADTRRLPVPVAANWDWQLRGACRTMSSDVFFHREAERGRSRRERDEHAKLVCRACPVMEACRRHALTADEPYGVWGGLSEDDRRALRHAGAPRDPGLRPPPGCGRTPRHEPGGPHDG